MPQIDPQIMRGLLGGNFVPGVDPQQEQENWLNLQAKRLALQRQPRLQALQEQNIQSEIQNRTTDNELKQATYDQNVSNAAALRKKDADAIALAAKKDADEKDRVRHASAAIGLHEDPSDERLAALVAQGSLNSDEQAAFAAIPLEKRKAEARALMIKNMLPAELEAYDTKQSTIANQASEIAKRQAEIDATKATKAQTDEAYGLWADQNKLPRNALTRLQFERMSKEVAQSAPNTPAKYALLIAKGKAPGATPEDQKAGQIAQAAMGVLTQQTIAGRPVTNLYTPAPPSVDGGGNQRQSTIEDVPAGLRSQVQSVLSYGTKLPPSSRSNPTNQAIRDWVTKVDPNYSEGAFAARNKIAQDFSASGVSGKAITSTDTALAHLDTISRAGRALKSGDITALNRLANAIGAQTGNAAPTVYDSIVETVAPEISKAVIGGVGGVEDRRQMAANFSRNLSDQAREGAIAANATLLSARVKKMAEAYESDMGKPLARKLSAESQAVLDRYSGKGAGPKAGDMKDYGGAKYKFDGKQWNRQ